jgi:hypothetical protein
LFDLDPEGQGHFGMNFQKGCVDDNLTAFKVYDLIYDLDLWLMN